MKKYFSIISVLLIIASLSACSVVDAEKLSSISTTAVTEVAEQTSSNEEKTMMLESTTELITTAVTTTVKEVLSTTGKSAASTSTKAIESTRVKTTKAVTTTVKAVKKLPGYYPEKEMIELFEAVNDYREANGVKRLVLDETLCKLAYVRAEEQVYARGHMRPNGSYPWTICDEYGCVEDGFGENIIRETPYTPDTQARFIGWKNSPSHNECMLKSKWTKSGIGLYVDKNNNCYIVQLFGY